MGQQDGRATVDRETRTCSAESITQRVHARDAGRDTIRDAKCRQLVGVTRILGLPVMTKSQVGAVFGVITGPHNAQLVGSPPTRSRFTQIKTIGM